MSDKFALICGVGNYSDKGLSQLVAPNADVHAFAEVLRSADIGAFDEVVTLVNETDVAVRRALARFVSHKRSDDLLLFYFSGHGLKDARGQLYFALQDTEPELLTATAMSAAHLSAEMERSASRRQVIILDCCYSGSFARGAKAGGSSVGIAEAFQGNGYGRFVLTATDETQYAWEGDAFVGSPEVSLFTHYLVEALRTGDADLDDDGDISLDELYEYVYKSIAAKTTKQTPGKWSYKQQGDVKIAKRSRKGISAGLSRQLLALVASPYATVRLAAVRELSDLLVDAKDGVAVAARTELEKLANDAGFEVAGAARESLALADGEAISERLWGEPLSNRQITHMAQLFRDNRLTFVLGPNVNRAGRPAQYEWTPDGPFAPTLDELARLLARYLGITKHPTSDPVDFMGGFGEVCGTGELYLELHRLLDRDYVPTAIHQLLVQLSSFGPEEPRRHCVIVTTALDDVLERTFARAGKPVDVLSFVGTGELVGRLMHRVPDGTETLVDVPNEYDKGLLEHRPVIVKLMGGVNRANHDCENDHYVVTEEALTELLRRSLPDTLPPRVGLALRKTHFVFAECDAGHRSDRTAFHWLVGAKRVTYKSWAVITKPRDTEYGFWQHHNVALIRATPDEYANALMQQLQNSREG